MLELLRTQDVGPAPSLEMELAPRLNLLTGDNGLGKTFLLDIAWWALTRTWSGMPAFPHQTAGVQPIITFRYGTANGGHHQYQSHFHREIQLWNTHSERPPASNLVLYAQVDGSFSVWDPARNFTNVRELTSPLREPAYRFAPSEVWDGLPLDTPKKLCNGLIVDWASWQRENGEAFLQLTRVLERLSPSKAEPLAPGKLARISLDDVRDHPTLKMPYGQEVPLVQASAAIRRIVALGYLLVWTWQEHLRACELLGVESSKSIVFLIDEIESHLHPQWQRRIIPALLDVMQALTPRERPMQVQLVGATHSALVMTSIETRFDPERDAWFDLDLDTNTSPPSVELRRRDFVRHGDVSNWLTSEAFDLKEPRSLEAEHGITQALALLRTEAPSVQEIERVDALLRASLSDIDRFWVRWSAFRDRHEGAA